MVETPVPHAAAGRSVGHGLLWPALLALTIVLTVALQAVNAPLKTPAAPQGIVSYEFAGTTAAAQSILDSWDAGAKVYAGFSLGLDYLYMPTYALTIGLACAWNWVNFSFTPGWHCWQVPTTFCRERCEAGFDGGRMSCAPWQSLHLAVLA